MIASKEVMAAHLAGMVRFPTVSYSDESQMNFEPFYAMHKYLEETYPLLHKTFKREIIGRAALLYKWESPNKKEGKLPLLLGAHQDVVPEGDLNLWKYPPYAGQIADGFIWGRGSMDCKSLIMGEMEAIEALIADGFVPDYDLYLAYGYNEEVGITTERPSAKLIIDTLIERGVRIGVAMDEGGAIYPGSQMGIDDLVANVGVAEKGYADYLIYKTDKGGHSAAPGKTCIMGDVAKAVAKLADNPRPYRVIPEIARQYSILAPYVGDRKEIYENIAEHKDYLFPILDREPRTAAKFQTTMALTMASGSAQANVLPSKVSVRMNCRLLKGDTVESLLNEFRALVGEESGVKVDLIAGRDPSPFSDIDCEEYRNLEKVLDEIYPGIKAIPSMCVGGTDSYFYYPGCEHVFRFSGEVRNPLNGPSHSANEKFQIETIESVPNFFYHYLPRY